MFMLEVKLPDIGEGVTEGELVQWAVSVGDSVEMDQTIAEIMTDKATVEVPSPVNGVVKGLSFKEGDMIPVGATMVSLEQKSSKASEVAQPDLASVAVEQKSISPSPVFENASLSSTKDKIHPPAAESSVLATPATRRLAREMDVDINLLTGSGLAGRVTRENVLAHSKISGSMASDQNHDRQISSPLIDFKMGGEERVPLRGIRRKIAEQMQNTKRVVPHFTLMDEANVTELVLVRSKAKEKALLQGIKVTYLPFIIKALIATIREYPMFNGSIDDEAQEIVYKKYFNIGFAADTPNGLLVPVIKNADQKTILQLSQEIVDLSEKARAGKLSLDEMRGATITITNIGSIGGTYATPIINHPEVAILGVYKISDKPIFLNGEFKPAKIQNYTVTCDHRLIDGAVAANFLRAFFQRIENPSALMLDMI